VCASVVQVRESEQGRNTESEADLKSRWEREREGKTARDDVPEKDVSILSSKGT